MASTIKINALCAAFALCACAIANPASAGVFDFTGGNPIYDANRSTTVQDSGYHYDENLALISGPDKVGATVGFNWLNHDWGTTEAPYWMYSWDGINVSNCSDTSVSTDPLVYINAGEKGQYTSVNGTDADGVVGGAYGVFFGSQHNGSGLSDSTAGVADGWVSADLTRLNEEDGLLGLYFELWTDNYNDYGALAPAYFALDNITYNIVPEPAQFAALFGALMLGFAFVRRRSAR